MVLCGGARTVADPRNWCVPYYLPWFYAVAQIFAYAFNPQAVTYGTIGSFFICMRYGIARGIYSNEVF
jgi:Na+/alanine symporter